jgi:sugar phosphate isomerase/epimerase
MATLTYHDGTEATIKVGYRTPGLTALSPSAKIELAAELGIEVVETMMGRDFESLAEAEEMREAAKDLGVTIPSTGAPLPITIPGTQHEIRAKIATYLQYIEILGCSYAFCRFLPAPEGIPQADTWETVRENGRLAADLFGEADVKWAIEADPGCFVNTLERLERALDWLDHPNVYPNYDPTNLYVEGSNPLRAVEVLGDRIHSGHIKDGVYNARGRRERPVGTGEVPYPAIFQAILDRGLRINMHIEHCREPSQVRAAAAYIQGVLDQLTGKAG